MASILRVNTLTDASSNNSTAMSVINQGVAKAWFFANGDASLQDSTNMASATDNSTGNYGYTFTNNMNNDDTSQTTTANTGIDRGSNTSGRATTGLTVEVFNQAGSNDDSNFSATIHGDLA